MQNEWDIDNLFFHSQANKDRLNTNQSVPRCAVPRPPEIAGGDIPLTQAFSAHPRNITQGTGRSTKYPGPEATKQRVGVVKPSQVTSKAGSIRPHAFRPPELRIKSQVCLPSQPSQSRKSDDIIPNFGTCNDRPQEFSYVENSQKAEPRPLFRKLTSANAFNENLDNFTVQSRFTDNASEEDRRRLLLLRSTTDIPEKFRPIFDFPYFNAVQSKIFDDALYTDCAIVLCAPTGSGKTVAFELAIIRLMMQNENLHNMKIVYMAPIKALCSERFADWSRKFGALGLRCMELTGDTEMDEYFDMQSANLILTTPEKWDSMTRRWRDKNSLVGAVRLFLIDEVHLLNDDTRGATMEAVVSRMKTIVKSAQEKSRVVHASDNVADPTGNIARGSDGKTNSQPCLRFLAVSATVPNVDDIATWLTVGGNHAIAHKMDESLRPVRLRKVVIGYPCSENTSDFRFDLTLNYKLANVIETYAEQKPTLVFCATRKSVQQGASILAKEAKFILTSQHKQRLQVLANSFKDSKLRDLTLSGVGYHHAGLDLSDRKGIETLFSQGDLPVLLATSTLAMGVNLPAHLVIIKSTQHYVMGAYQEYGESQILQMIGRAGRPQFDTTATAVIMTRSVTKHKYESLLNGTQVIDSSLHSNLTEHLNAEIVLGTISDISVALGWLRSTFLYIRVMKNPRHYGIASGLSKEKVEQRLQDMCLKNVNSLASIQLVTYDDDGFTLEPTASGRLMARYCVAFETMKNFHQIKGDETLQDLLMLMCSSQEFKDTKLRTNEKKTLNTLNKDKNRTTIRFELNGKIKTTEMKVNCLIQATLGSLTIQDFPLQQDVARIFRAGLRVARCLVETLWQRPHFTALLNAVLLSKCFTAKMWENSRHVTRQLTGIGSMLANALVNAGVITFQKAEDMNPRDIELIVNRHPPFGNQVHDAVTRLPKYELCIDQASHYTASTADLHLSVSLANADLIKEKCTVDKKHTCVLLLGAQDNSIVYKSRISDALLLREGTWSARVRVQRCADGEQLSVNLISQEWVGLDVQSLYTPFYTGPKSIPRPKVPALAPSATTPQPKTPALTGLAEDGRKPCSHRCVDKQTCGHECCKLGVATRGRKVDNMRSQVRAKYNMCHGQGPVQNTPQCNDTNLQRFGYTPAASMLVHSSMQNQATRQPNLESPDHYSNAMRPSETPYVSKGWEMLDLHQSALHFVADSDSDTSSVKDFTDYPVVEDFQTSGAKEAKPQAWHEEDDWHLEPLSKIPRSNYNPRRFNSNDAFPETPRGQENLCQPNWTTLGYRPVCITGGSPFNTPKTKSRTFTEQFKYQASPRNRTPVHSQERISPYPTSKSRRLISDHFPSIPAEIQKKRVNSDHLQNPLCNTFTGETEANFDLESDFELSTPSESKRGSGIPREPVNGNSTFGFIRKPLATKQAPIYRGFNTISNDQIPCPNSHSFVKENISIKRKATPCGPYASFTSASNLIKQGTFVEKQNPDEGSDMEDDFMDRILEHESLPVSIKEKEHSGRCKSESTGAVMHSLSVEKEICDVPNRNNKVPQMHCNKANVSPDSAELSQELDRFEASFHEDVKSLSAKNDSCLRLSPVPFQNADVSTHAPFTTAGGMFGNKHLANSATNAKDTSPDVCEDIFADIF